MSNLLADGYIDHADTGMWAYIFGLAGFVFESFHLMVILILLSLELISITVIFCANNYIDIVHHYVENSI